MVSCIIVFYIALSGAPAAAYGDAHAMLGRTDAPITASRGAHAVVQQRSQSDPDVLYAAREDLSSVRRAAEIWAGRLTRDPSDFEAAWKLARASYWLGGHAPQRERKALLEGGIRAAQAAVAAAPDRPDGHFWIAANMGALAESFGIRQGLRFRGRIRDELLIVLKLDPAFQQGSADRALGRWYYKVPALFGGSKRRSEEHLRRSLSYNPHNTASLFFLAETLIALDRPDDARRELLKLLQAPPNAGWEPEDREFKARATQLLAHLR